MTGGAAITGSEGTAECWECERLTPGDGWDASGIPLELGDEGKDRSDLQPGSGEGVPKNSYSRLP